MTTADKESEEGTDGYLPGHEHLRRSS